MHLPFNGDSKDAFFANRTNKQRFIDLLSVTMEDHGIKALHADGDADQLIKNSCCLYKNPYNSSHWRRYGYFSADCQSTDI